MTMERDAEEMDTTFAEKLRERIFVGFKSAGGALSALPIRLRGMAAGTKTSTWIVFAIVVAGNIIAFDYYQARITRYYLSVLLMNIVRMNDDMDLVQAEINRLNKRTDDIRAKLDKSVQPSSLELSTPPSS